MLEIHSTYLVVRINLVFSSLLIFALMASMTLGTNLLGVCLIGFLPSKMGSLCYTRSLLSQAIFHNPMQRNP